MKEFPLSDQRRQLLREGGIFPLSSDVQTLFVLLGAVLAGAQVPARFSILLNAAHTFEPGTLRMLAKQILILCGIIPLGAFAGGAIGTLLQSRFLFRISSSGAAQKFREPVLMRLVLAGLRTAAVLAIGWLVFQKMSAELIASGPTELHSARIMAQSLFGLLLAFALLGRLLVQIIFSQRYRVTQEEAAAESRESEMRPELRSATERSYSGES